MTTVNISSFTGPSPAAFAAALSAGCGPSLIEAMMDHLEGDLS